MTTTHADGSTTTSCPHCEWGSGPQHTAMDAVEAIRAHLLVCEPRAAYFAGTRTETRA